MKNTTIKIIHCMVGVVVALSIYIVSLNTTSLFNLNKEVYTADSTEISKQADRIVNNKIRALQDDVLNQLSLGCEVLGSDEPWGEIVFDTNNRPSIGGFQFQIPTVQHYMRVFHSKDISRVESISIAINKEVSTELARLVVFHETGGIRNWKNCERKKGLAPQIAIIKKIMK